MKKTVIAVMVSVYAAAAPYYCRSLDATFSDAALCASACGVACQELQPTGDAGSCDTAAYKGFVYHGGKTYAISKERKFWSGFGNLAMPKTEQINRVLAAVTGYYGADAWIGVYDPKKSTGYNTPDPGRFVFRDGSATIWANWSTGQPDNRVEQEDIGTVAPLGEHWVVMAADGTWSDLGLHAVFPEADGHEPLRYGLVEFNGRLGCVDGTPDTATVPASQDDVVSAYCNGETPCLICSDGVQVARCGCPAGTVYDAGRDLCTGDPICPPGTVLNSGTLMCEGGSSCAAGGVYDPGTGKCVDEPSSCIHINDGKSYTVPKNGWIQTSYFRMWYDDRCYATTPTDMHFVLWGTGTGTTTKEYTVPPGERIATFSHSGTVNPTNGSREPTVTPPSCPDGQRDLDGTCVADPKCPDGTVRNGGECISPHCPLGEYGCTDVNESGTVAADDTVQGANDKQNDGMRDEEGNCLGRIYIFNGNDSRCRTAGLQTGGSNCCVKGTKWIGLAKCNQTEQQLAKLREFGQQDGQCRYIGDYCAVKVLKVCLQKKKTYCCFSSPLARIIQEGGRQQLGIPWGDPRSPNCRGFTPEEFQKIDFSKIDFSDWVDNELTPNILNGASKDIENITKGIRDSFSNSQ